MSSFFFNWQELTFYVDFWCSSHINQYTIINGYGQLKLSMQYTIWSKYKLYIDSAQKIIQIIYIKVKYLQSECAPLNP